MRIAIIDDNRAEQENLRNCIIRWAAAEGTTVSVNTYDSGEKFCSLMKYANYDMVFIDIIMDGKNGIQTAKILRNSNVDSLIVFITTSREFMAEAFPCHAFDYVVKPYECERIYRVLSDGKRVLKKLEDVIEIGDDRFILSDIMYIYSDSNYCVIYTKNDTKRIRISFTELSQKLTVCPSFYVVSRGAAVNFDNTSHISENDCVMDNGDRVPISRRKVKEVEKHFMDRQFSKLLEKGQ